MLFDLYNNNCIDRIWNSSRKPNDRLLLTGHSCYFACFNLVTNKVQVDNQPLALANAPSSFWLDLHCLLSVQESVREVRAS